MTQRRDAVFSNRFENEPGDLHPEPTRENSRKFRMLKILALHMAFISEILQIDNDDVELL